MKKAITFIALALVLLLTILLVLQVTSAGKQPIQLIPDMTTATSHPRKAPPEGAVPFGTPRPAQPARQLFRNHCAACHGNNGNGQSYVANYAGMPAVGNLTTTAKSPAELKNSLLNGRGAMPAFRNRINDTEADSLIQHIFNHLQTK